MTSHWFALKNAIDFFLRNRLQLSRKITHPDQIPQRDLLLQAEFKEFFELFPWPTLLEKLPHQPLIVSDIGTRNFVFGPVIDELLQRFGREAQIHGIEIDAHRLLWGFHSRADYGRYYAATMRSGFFHPVDFLKWTHPSDLLLMLNPFVTKEPLLSWGLPLSQLKPAELFRHAMTNLKPRRGIMILSCPSLVELDIAKRLAAQAGFHEGASVVWEPKGKSVQQKPRYGIVYFSEVSS